MSNSVTNGRFLPNAPLRREFRAPPSGKIIARQVGIRDECVVALHDHLLCPLVTGARKPMPRAALPLHRSLESRRFTKFQTLNHSPI
nr:hypothetical protein [Burkholderia multivorans]